MTARVSERTATARQVLCPIDTTLRNPSESPSLDTDRNGHTDLSRDGIALL